jgi:hypothetical protein
MARSTVRRYKSKQDDPQAVGRDLRVDAVLTGRLVQHGDQLDLESEMVDVATGAQLWGRKYSHSNNDVSAFQSEMSLDVATRLRPSLSTAQQEKLSKRGTADAEAYRLYLQAWYHFDKVTASDHAKALELFEQAVARDPSYAAAYAGLAIVSAMQGYWGYVSGRTPFDKDTNRCA